MLWVRRHWKGEVVPKGTASKVDVFAAFAAKVGERLPRDLPQKTMHELINNPYQLAEHLRSAFVTRLGTDRKFLVTVNYDLSFAEMIAAGCYDWVNHDIAAERRVNGGGIREFECRLFHFNRAMTSEDVVREIEMADCENPWSSGTIEHELAFGATFPEEQRKHPILALGSSCRIFGSRDIPCLDEDDSGRGLTLRWWASDWRGICRFLAVRKLSSAA